MNPENSYPELKSKQTIIKKAPNYKALSLIIFILLIVAIGLYSVLIKNQTTPNTNGSNLSTGSITISDKGVANISQGTDNFTFNILKSISKDKNEAENNIFISPLSISMAMDLATNGANGKTQLEMLKALGMSQYKLADINKFNQNLISSLKSDSKKELSIANSLWANNNFPILDSYKKLATDYYQASAQNLNFNDSKSADIINSWVSDKTNAKIPTIIDSGSLKQMQMMLINAVYFKSNWNSPFDKSLTESQEFNLGDGSKINTPLMNDTGDKSYYETSKFQAVSLPYKDTNLTMDIFLPAKKTKVEDFAATINWQTFDDWLTKFQEKNVHLALPKFKIEYEKGLIDQFKDLGVKNAFDSDLADFSQISDQKLYINLIKHKTYIDVDETGTEAAAVTGLGMYSLSAIPEPPKTIEMIIDRPFFFVIRDNVNKVNLFAGIIKNPTK